MRYWRKFFPSGLKAVTKPFFGPSKDVDGMYNYAYLLIVDYHVLKLAAAFSPPPMFIPWNCVVQRLSTGIKHTEVPCLEYLVLLHLSQHHTPDPSFSVHMSVCLSFLHSLTTSCQVSITQASLSPVINTEVIFYLGIIWNVFLYNLPGCVGDAVKNKEWEKERFFLLLISIYNF